MSLKIATVNSEHGRHLPDLFAFVEREKPDVLCLQEVFEKDVVNVQSQTGMQGYFSPVADIQEVGTFPVDPFGIWGEIILWNTEKVTRKPVRGQLVREEYYVGSRDTIPLFTGPLTPNRVMQVMQFDKAGETFVVGNTHFTWSAQGLASPMQFADFKRLAHFLDLYPELLLCGDFNAPRGGEIFALFTQRFADNIPPDVVTTIDSSRHYSGKQIDLVVDNIFSTSHYKVDSVRVIAGVSDHYAVVGEVSRATSSQPSL